MSSDYNWEIVVDWGTMGKEKVPINEYGHYLDVYTVKPVESQPIWDYQKHCSTGNFKSPRDVALDNVCDRNLLGLKRKFYWAKQLTSPYGSLQFAIGSGDDFHCYDYAFLPDGQVALDATVNSETGGFIQGAGYEICSPEDAPSIALGMVEMGIDWLEMNGLRHNKKGWNQDPFYFYRSVCIDCSADVHFSERQKRFGGKKIDEFCKIYHYLA